MAPPRQRKARPRPCSYAISASEDALVTASPSLSVNIIPVSFPLPCSYLIACCHVYVTFFLPRRKLFPAVMASVQYYNRRETAVWVNAEVSVVLHVEGA